jgi:hypothetical protein
MSNIFHRRWVTVLPWEQNLQDKYLVVDILDKRNPNKHPVLKLDRTRDHCEEFLVSIFCLNRVQTLDYRYHMKAKCSFTLASTAAAKYAFTDYKR